MINPRWELEDFASLGRFICPRCLETGPRIQIDPASETNACKIADVFIFRQNYQFWACGALAIRVDGENICINCEHPLDASWQRRYFGIKAFIVLDAEGRRFEWDRPTDGEKEEYVVDELEDYEHWRCDCQLLGPPKE